MLETHAVITMGDKQASLVVGDSSARPWNLTKTLTIRGYKPGRDKLVFGKDNLDFIVGPFREFAEFFQCKNAGMLLIPNCSTPEKLGADVEQQAREFARKLATV